MSAVGLILLVACANIANLLLARSERRQTEVALRSTLGAGRGRITRQLATESLVLAGVASVVGIGLAWIGTEALIAIDPTSLPRLGEVRLDGTVLGFTLGVTLLTALLFGIAPAYLAGRRAASGLASSVSHTAGGRRAASVRRLLVAGEVAVSLVVVILAGLVARSFSALTSTDLAMDPENLVTFSVTLPSSAYSEPEALPLEWENLLERVRAVPGVTEATAATALPFGGTSQWDFQLDDRPPRQQGDLAWSAAIATVSTEYFETLGVELLEGRLLTPQDGTDDPLVAVVSESMQEWFWPGESAIGKRFGYEMAEDSVPWMTIVGVVPDPVRQAVSDEPYPHVYTPHAQSAISTYGVPRTMTVAVRTGTEPESLVPALRAAVSEFDPDLPLYGVISYSVAGRTREIGVRVALGAERATITRMVLREGAVPLMGGIVIGLLAAGAFTRVADGLLYGVEPTDPLTFVTLPLALLAVGMLASLVPARRATLIAPTEALRE